jgi:hypothetical protein
MGPSPPDPVRQRNPCGTTGLANALRREAIQPTRSSTRGKTPFESFSTPDRFSNRWAFSQAPVPANREIAKRGTWRTPGAEKISSRDPAGWRSVIGRPGFSPCPKRSVQVPMDRRSVPHSAGAERPAMNCPEPPHADRPAKPPDRPAPPACPVCGGKLIEIRAKLVCSRCHTVCEGCCEGGRG